MKKIVNEYKYKGWLIKPQENGTWRVQPVYDGCPIYAQELIEYFLSKECIIFNTLKEAREWLSTEEAVKLKDKYLIAGEQLEIDFSVGDRVKAVSETKDYVTKFEENEDMTLSYYCNGEMSFKKTNGNFEIIDFKKVRNHIAPYEKIVPCSDISRGIDIHSFVPMNIQEGLRSGGWKLSYSGFNPINERELNILIEEEKFHFKKVKVKRKGDGLQTWKKDNLIIHISFMDNNFIKIKGNNKCVELIKVKGENSEIENYSLRTLLTTLKRKNMLNCL